MAKDKIFASAFAGGFECTTKLLCGGRRLDIASATRHDRFAQADYGALVSHGLRVARDGLRWHRIEPSAGQRDWTSFDPMLAAARASGIEVWWDLLHFGLPDWADPFATDFADRFADFAAAAARRIGPGGRYVPINEISFTAWAGGEVGYIAPFAQRRGDALKRALCAAAVAAIHAVRAEDPRALIATAEPLIHISPVSAGQTGWARGYSDSQHDALDALLGHGPIAVGGQPGLVDVVGYNFYPNNQFTTAGDVVRRHDPRYIPLAALLSDALLRHDKPAFVAETGAEASDRAGWLRYVCEEVRRLNRRRPRILALCLYPILNHLGWDDDRYCENGLWCGLSGPPRTRDFALSAELTRQQAFGLGCDPDLAAPMPAYAVER